MSPTVGRVRNRYLDLLRAAAILRVVVYHTFGWAWLTVALPAMGVMFAIAGSLMAASLADAAARRVVLSRMRRLLPPMWVLALVSVPLMMAHGWSPADLDRPVDLFFWLVPLGDPPGSEWGRPLWEALWYLRAYLCFVLASPLLYAVYRRAGWSTVAAPLVLLAGLNLTGFALPGPADAAMWDFAIYGACWMVGFAHRDGRLARLPLPVLLGLAAAAATGGLAWLVVRGGGPGVEGLGSEGLGAEGLGAEPVAEALWSLAFVLLVLRWRPALGWLDRRTGPGEREGGGVRPGPLDAAVRLLNARAVTVYLWHVPMISLTAVLLAGFDTGALDAPLMLAGTLLLTGTVVVAVGWVEDLAARRRPAVWPVRRPVGRRAAGRVAGPEIRGG